MRKPLITLEQLQQDFPSPTSTIKSREHNTDSYCIGGAFCTTLAKFIIQSQSLFNLLKLNFTFPTIGRFAQYLEHYDNSDVKDKTYYYDIALAIVTNNTLGFMSKAWEILGNFLSEANARKEE